MIDPFLMFLVDFKALVFGRGKALVFGRGIHKKKVFLNKLFLAQEFSPFKQHLGKKINDLECLYFPTTDQCAISNIISLCVRLEFKRLIFCLSFF